LISDDISWVFENGPTVTTPPHLFVLRELILMNTPLLSIEIAMSNGNLKWIASPMLRKDGGKKAQRLKMFV
jgi:hypothetical protein